ncbi:MAG: hypothetical protein MZV65_00200 [Chromatiales bacterium]|nr:hypothetical protein [Chromatiales bacterium]
MSRLADRPDRAAAARRRALLAADRGAARRALRRARSSLAARPSASLLGRGAAWSHWRPRGAVQRAICSATGRAPFGIVLVAGPAGGADAAAHRACSALAALLYALRRLGRGAAAHFHALFQFQLMGLQRRLPDRRPVQPVRVLRGAADRLLRPAAARRRARAAARRRSTTWCSTWPARRCS